MTIHGDDTGQVFNFEFPAGFGGTKFFKEIYVRDASHGSGRQRRRAADGLQIHGAVFLAGGERCRVHATLADDEPYARRRDKGRH